MRTAAAAHAVEVGRAVDHEALALDRVAVLVERVDKVADRRFDVVLAARNSCHATRAKICACMRVCSRLKSKQTITRRARLVDRVLHHHAELLLVAGVGRGLAAVDAVGSPPPRDLLQGKKSTGSKHPNDELAAMRHLWPVAWNDELPSIEKRKELERVAMRGNRAY